MSRRTEGAQSIKNSSAAVPQKAYSAEELAGIYMTSRPDFLVMDLEEVTLNWNPNYIYNFFYHVRDIKHIDLAIEWLAYAWKDKHHFEESYDNMMNKELAEECGRFAAMLNDIRRTLIQRFKNEENKQSLLEKMLEGYPNSVTTTAEVEPVDTCVESIETTEAPQFAQQIFAHDSDGGTLSQILIEDLPEHVKKCVVVSQPVFDIFVRQLNEDTWLIVEQNKGKYCDALRFLCNFHHILSRNTDREVFNDLLHAVVQKVKDAPSLISSMGRRSDTSTYSINCSYKYYANPVSTRRDDIWKLINDCKPLEESLQPVLEAMHREAAIASSVKR